MKTIVAIVVACFLMFVVAPIVTQKVAKSFFGPTPTANPSTTIADQLAKCRADYDCIAAVYSQ